MNIIFSVDLTHNKEIYKKGILCVICNEFVYSFTNDLKSFTAILLASIFLLQSFTRTFIIVNYQINKDYISNVLCENKEKKTLHCEGKCHLKKELDNEQKKEQAPAGNSKEKFEITLFNSINETQLVFSEIKSQTQFIYTSHLSEKFPDKIFHPPGFSA